MTDSHVCPSDAEAARAEYARRQARWIEECRRLERSHAGLGNLRLGLVAICIAVGIAAFGYHGFSAWWIAVPAALFALFTRRHDSVLQRLDLARRRARFYAAGLRRIDGAWPGHGTSGLRFLDAHHPYAADLDIFGRGSLFERLCTARTFSGEDQLAQMLLERADVETVCQRQAAVQELAPLLDLREDLAVLGEAARADMDPAGLIAWGRQQTVGALLARRYGATTCTALVVAASLCSGVIRNPLPFLAATAIAQTFDRAQRRHVRAALAGLDERTRDLELLSRLVARIEREAPEAPLLKRVRSTLGVVGAPPSARIAHLQRLAELADATRSTLFAAFTQLFLWRTHCALAVEQWRSVNGRSVQAWIEAVGTFEAICALASYAYERPESTFPEVHAGEPELEAKALAHPLLREPAPNDLLLGGSTRLLIVSGSNMSGKSTLLRAIGVNTVLALAGAPVCAAYMRLTPLSIGASIRTLDSLQAGVSRFYAEVTRLRQIVEIATEQPPALFLLDEALHGTNSHDRRIGAEAVARALVARNAIGLLTTHDLALAAIAEDANARAANVHFADELVDGKLRFDYRLRPGVVEHSNALELMRAVGLEV